MMCDFIIAADTAKFGQPEINLGVVAGIGGTQRLTRFVGKSKSMDMNLTGRFMDAEEAERAGLVSRVVPAKKLMEEAMAAAAEDRREIADRGDGRQGGGQPRYETTLREGLLFERRLFHALFATEDQSEGMAAFLEKREAAVPRQVAKPVFARQTRTKGTPPWPIRPSQETRPPEREAPLCRQQGAPVAHPHLPAQGRGGDRLRRQGPRPRRRSRGQPELMRGVTKGVLHKNTASRKMSRLAARGEECLNVDRFGHGLSRKRCRRNRVGDVGLAVGRSTRNPRFVPRASSSRDHEHFVRSSLRVGSARLVGKFCVVKCVDKAVVNDLCAPVGPGKTASRLHRSTRGAARWGPVMGSDRGLATGDPAKGRRRARDPDATRRVGRGGRSLGVLKRPAC
jgi:hypothetical protein